MKDLNHESELNTSSKNTQNALSLQNQNEFNIQTNIHETENKSDKETQ